MGTCRIIVFQGDIILGLDRGFMQLKFHRLVAKIIKVPLGIKNSGYSIFRVRVSEKIICL